MCIYIYIYIYIYIIAIGEAGNRLRLITTSKSRWFPTRILFNSRAIVKCLLTRSRRPQDTRFTYFTLRLKYICSNWNIVTALPRLLFKSGGDR